jgi:hypothetical protein
MITLEFVEWRNYRNPANLGVKTMVSKPFASARAFSSRS